MELRHALLWVALFGLACSDGASAGVASIGPTMSAGAAGAGGTGGAGVAGAAAGATTTGGSAGENCSPGCVFIGSQTCDEVPNMGAVPAIPDGDRVDLLTTRIVAGDEGLDEGLDPEAWRRFGTNLDGVNTTLTKQSACFKAPGGQSLLGSLDDGGCGMDNALGRSGQLRSADQSNAIKSGVRSWALSMGSALPASGGKVSAQILGASSQGGSWVVAPYVTGSTDENRLTLRRLNDWLASDEFDAYLELTHPFEGRPFPIHLKRARLFARLNPDGVSADRGVLTGIANVKEVLHSVCESLNPFVASNSADLMLDGSPGQYPCDGVSVAIGFRAAVTKVSEGAAIPKAKVCL